MSKTFKQVFADSTPEMTEKAATIQGDGLMAKAMKAHQDEQEAGKLKAMSSLVSALFQAREQHVANLRAIRAQEKAAKAKLAEFEEAAEYFEKTGNFGPLSKFIRVQSACIILGCAMQAPEDQKIPVQG